MERYIARLEALYNEHNIWDRSMELARKILTASSSSIIEKYFQKFNNLNQERLLYMRAAEKLTGLPPPNGVYE